MISKVCRAALTALGIAVLLLLVVAGQQAFGQQSPSAVPEPEPMTNARLLSLLGESTVQIRVQADYITQLRQRITELNAELDKFKSTAK